MHAPSYGMGSRSFTTAALNCCLGLHANNGLQGKKKKKRKGLLEGCASLPPRPESALPVTQTGRVGPKRAACLEEESCIFYIFAMFCSSPSPGGTCKVVTAEKGASRAGNQTNTLRLARGSRERRDFIFCSLLYNEPNTIFIHGHGPLAVKDWSSLALNESSVVAGSWRGT